MAAAFVLCSDLLTLCPFCQSFEHLQHKSHPLQRDHRAATLYCPGSRVITESDYNDSAVRAATKHGGVPKRQGPTLEDIPAVKGTWLQVGSAVGPSLQEEPTCADDMWSEPVEPLPEMFGPHDEGLLHPMNHPSRSPTARASVPLSVPPQRPKVAAKKKLASHCLPLSPVIPLPLGEWPRNGLEFGGSEPPICPGPTSGTGVAGDIVPPLTSVSERGSEDPLALYGLRASVLQSGALGQALQVALDDFSKATEARTKVSGPRTSRSSPQARSRF